MPGALQVEPNKHEHPAGHGSDTTFCVASTDRRRLIRQNTRPLQPCPPTNSSLAPPPLRQRWQGTARRQTHTFSVRLLAANVFNEMA